MEEDLHELLRQEDEEASFADKYAEELEMMDGMETGWWWQCYDMRLYYQLYKLDFVQPSSQPVSSSRKSLGYYGEGAKESLDESPLPPLPSSNNNSLSSSGKYVCVVCIVSWGVCFCLCVFCIAHINQISFYVLILTSSKVCPISFWRRNHKTSRRNSPKENPLYSQDNEQYKNITDGP